MSAGTVVLRAERPADAASVGAVVSIPRPSGQVITPQQFGHLRLGTPHHQVMKTCKTTCTGRQSSGFSVLIISTCRQGPDQRGREDAGPHESAGSHHQRGS